MTLGCFYQLGGPFCGCPCNEALTLLGSTLGPLILGNSLTHTHTHIYTHLLSGFRRPVCFRAKKHPEYCLAVVNILYKYSKYLYNIVNILYKYSKYSYKYSKYSYKYSKYSYKYSKYSYKYSKYSYKYFKRNVLSILGDILHLLELFVAVC